MIFITCPSCEQTFRAPDTAAGKRAKCPSCRCALQIPDLTSEPPRVVVWREPTPEGAAVLPVPVSTSTTRAILGAEIADVRRAMIEEARRRDEEARQRELLELRLAIERQGRDQAGYRCPYCKSDTPPWTRSRVSAAGWATFTVLLLSCAFSPLCIIGLAIREHYRVCPDCGMCLG